MSPIDRRISTAERIKHLAHELLPRSEWIAAQVVAPVLHEVAEVSPRGPQVATRSTEQNISAMLATLAFGLDPTAFGPPPATLELVRNLHEAGGDLNLILRGYRVGHRRFWELWAEHVCDRVHDREELQAVLSASSTDVFALFDSVVSGIEDYHHTELEKRTDLDPHHRSAAAAITALLGPQPADLDEARSVLGYDIRAHHVATVLSPAAADASVRSARDELVARLGQPRVLWHPVGDGSVWMWLSWPHSPDDQLLTEAAEAPLQTAVIGIGEPGQGRDGFRRSHEQALEAQHIRRLHPNPSPGVVRYQNIELAAVLCANPDRARSFARQQLGPLHGGDDANERLRQTLRTFYACGHNKARTAELLFVHQRTISYRMTRAEELLGGRIEQRAAELQAALIIIETLGD